MHSRHTIHLLSCGATSSLAGGVHHFQPAPLHVLHRSPSGISLSLWVIGPPYPVGRSWIKRRQDAVSVACSARERSRTQHRAVSTAALRAVALLELLTRATPARVVAADLVLVIDHTLLHHRHQLAFRAVAQRHGRARIR